jgi:hypothetical protein
VQEFWFMKTNEIQKQPRKLQGVVDTEAFTNRNREYYFDIKRSKNGQYYLRVNRRDKIDDDNFRRHDIIFFEEDIGFMVEAMAMLLGSTVRGNWGQVHKWER